jgi:nitroimidazol reductase NimA-like FMN-containing flavoprotein (pyridoxamine 5'-phosphate oxidase superfamily)
VKYVQIEFRGDHLVKMYELDAVACRQLLVRCTFGRVAFDGDDGLTVLPVNCLFSGDVVVFRTQEGSALDRLDDGRAVAFETDHVDPVSESGWSVLIRGKATHLTDQERTAALTETGIHTWAPGPRDRWVQIHPQRITGRIIYRQRLIDEGEQVARMPPD